MHNCYLFEHFAESTLFAIIFLYLSGPIISIRHRGLLYEADVEKGKLPLPSHQIIGLSLLGVILVSPIVERSFLYFLLGTWVLQALVIITFYPTKKA